jgi:hypothetical protein
MGAERLERFAAECEAMARGARSPKDRAVWKGLAQRWLRCAELVDQYDARPAAERLRRRQTKVPLALGL